MKLKYVVCLLVAACTAVGFAEDAAKPYVRVSAGVSIVNDADICIYGINAAEAEFDPGFAMDIAAGMEMTATDEKGSLPVRAEIELGIQQSDLDKFEDKLGLGISTGDGEILTVATMLNGYIDIKNDSIVTPYVTAGIGGVYVDVELEGDSDDDFVIAGQLGAGVGIAVNEQVTVDAGYRFLLADDPEFSDDIEMELSTHRVQVGVRIAL